MRGLRLLMLGAFAGLVPLLLPATATGHGLSAKVFLTGGRLRVEAQYSDGSPASHGTVKVSGYRPGQSGAGQPLLLEEKLDLEGKYAFSPRSAQDLYFVIEDNAGHRAEVHVPAKILALHQQGPEKDPGGLVDPIAVSPGPLFLEGAPGWERILIGVAAILCLGFLAGCVLRRVKAS